MKIALVEMKPSCHDEMTIGHAQCCPHTYPTSPHTNKTCVHLEGPDEREQIDGHLFYGGELPERDAAAAAARWKR